MGEFLLGIDLGTTNAKAILIDRRGKIIFLTSCSYPILAPRPNFSEQDPQVWWRASKDMLNKISSMVNLKDIKAIGLSGQMHGLVMVDKRGLPLKNAIIWTDSRSTPQVKEMEDKVGEGRLYTITGFPPFPGFLGPSLLWIKENQSHILKKINCVLLPKDYLKFKFTENFSTDFSDASGTLLFDIEKRQWSEEIIEKLDLPFEIFPQVLESSQIAGTISHKAHEETGLSKDTIVLCGGGDQAISAISNGVIKEGTVSSTIGTGGQILTATGKPLLDRKRRLHTFCHSLTDRWLLMGAILSAGLSLKWFKENILKTEVSFNELQREASKIPPCSEGLLFLPYLVGERTPHMNPHAEGVFFGLSLKSSPAHMVRAVMEGVTFALKDCFVVLEEVGIKVERVVAAGGGAKSPLWLQMQADIFEREILISEIEEQAAYGAALLAGLGAGVFKSLKEIETKFLKYRKSVFPIKKNIERYREIYSVFKSLYRAVEKNY